jgi:hypothetical protein
MLTDQWEFESYGQGLMHVCRIYMKIRELYGSRLLIRKSPVLCP